MWNRAMQALDAHLSFICKKEDSTDGVDDWRYDIAATETMSRRMSAAM
jgi:hypothetical protein